MNVLTMLRETVELINQAWPIPTAQLKLAALYSGICSR